MQGWNWNRVLALFAATSLSPSLPPMPWLTAVRARPHQPSLDPINWGQSKSNQFLFVSATRNLSSTYTDQTFFQSPRNGDDLSEGEPEPGSPEDNGNEMAQKVRSRMQPEEEEGSDKSQGSFVKL